MIQDVVGLEVNLATLEVHEPCRIEAGLFIEHQPDAPRAALNALAAIAAPGLPTRRSLGAVDPRQATMRQAAPRRAFQPVSIGRVSFREDLKQRLRPLEAGSKT